MIRFHGWMALPSLALVAACAGGYYSPTPYWTLHDVQFGSLKPGVTTQEDVRRTIGEPLLQMHFPRQNEDVWDYRYIEGSTLVSIGYLHFTPQGVLKYWEHWLDPAYYGGGVGGAGM